MIKKVLIIFSVLLWICPTTASASESNKDMNICHNKILRNLSVKINLVNMLAKRLRHLSAFHVVTGLYLELEKLEQAFINSRYLSLYCDFPLPSFEFDDLKSIFVQQYRKENRNPFLNNFSDNEINREAFSTRRLPKMRNFDALSPDYKSVILKDLIKIIVSGKKVFKLRPFSEVSYLRYMKDRIRKETINFVQQMTVEKAREESGLDNIKTFSDLKECKCDHDFEYNLLKVEDAMNLFIDLPSIHFTSKNRVE